MSMLTLSESFTHKGWLHEVVERTKQYALVKKTKGRAISWEVWRIMIHKPRTWPNGTISPLREAMPATTAWGTYGWTFLTEETARHKYDTLNQSQKP